MEAAKAVVDAQTYIIESPRRRWPDGNTGNAAVRLLNPYAFGRPFCTPGGGGGVSSTPAPIRPLTTPAFPDALGESNLGNAPSVDCKAQSYPQGSVTYPTPAEIKANPVVRAAAVDLMAATAVDGKEHGAWLVRNADGSIGHGE